MPPSPFTPPKWLPLAFEVLSSCSGNSGSSPVSFTTSPSARAVHELICSLLGIFLGFCANVIVKDTGDISWRLQLGSAFIPSFVLGVGIFFCPESPRWLMKHGKIAKGYNSMRRLRAHPIIGARDFYYSYVIYKEELKLARGAGYFARLWDCFAVPRIRRANYGASTVMIGQQMCGINSKPPHPLCEIVHADASQSSPSTAPASSEKSVTLQNRLCMRL